MNRDLLQQAVSAMRHDLRRTLLTIAGMAWGIATVVLLLAYGNGFATAIQNIFESFGATAVGVFPGRTSQQAGGQPGGDPNQGQQANAGGENVTDAEFEEVK